MKRVIAKILSLSWVAHSVVMMLLGIVAYEGVLPILWCLGMMLMSTGCTIYLMDVSYELRWDMDFDAIKTLKREFSATDTFIYETALKRPSLPKQKTEPIDKSSLTLRNVKNNGLPRKWEKPIGEGWLE